MSRVTQSEMDYLHGLHGRMLIKQMEDYVTGKVKDKQGNPLHPPTSLQQTVDRFLNNNRVNAPSEDAHDAIREYYDIVAAHEAKVAAGDPVSSADAVEYQLAKDRIEQHQEDTLGTDVEFSGENSEINTLIEKRCYSCGLVKPRTEFHKKTDRKDGLQGSCKDCRSAAHLGKASQKEQDHE